MSSFLPNHYVILTTANDYQLSRRVQEYLTIKVSLGSHTKVVVMKCGVENLHLRKKTNINTNVSKLFPSWQQGALVRQLRIMCILKRQFFNIEMLLPNSHCSCLILRTHSWESLLPSTSKGVKCTTGWMGHLLNLFTVIYRSLLGFTETSYCEILRAQLGTEHVALVLCESVSIQNGNSSTAIGIFYHLILGDRTQKSLLSLNLKIERLRKRTGK